MIAERMDNRGIEESRRRSAIGKREIIADGPVMRRYLLLDHRIGSSEGAVRFLDAIGVGLAFRPDTVGNDLAHGRVDIEIEEAVPQAGLEPSVLVGRQESDRPRRGLLEIFYDDAGLRDDALR